MDIVVAVDSNWGIGLNGTQTVVIPEDRKYFRELTKNSTVILGRRTLLDFPNAKPLPKRRNIILTTDKSFFVEGGEVAHSVEEAVHLCKNDEKVFVIGGASIYEQFLPLCKYAYITKLYASSEADRWFHNLDNDPNWKLVSPEERKLSGEIEYAFVKYENLSL
ncbi:MAG: dihydrofolate reductase [Ruminococcaceae bacterium]|nr:dihydrofolate reductase [Oscillospiraceae bacterium]